MILWVDNILKYYFKGIQISYLLINKKMNHLNPIDDVASAAESSVPADVEIDSTWVLVTSFSALLVILGFAFLASGAVRYKSV